jgi:hypothetical protein
MLLLSPLDQMNIITTIETCQTSFTTTPGSDDINSQAPARKQTSILNMQDLLILHSNNIYPHNNKDDFKAYKHLHGIDMQIHSIPKPPLQKAQEMELSDLHHEEFKIFAMEYNTPQQEPHNKLDHFVRTLQQHTRTLIRESMIRSLTIWIPPFMPCKCKIQMY